VTLNNELVCTYMVMSGLGVNDFSRHRDVRGYGRYLGGRGPIWRAAGRDSSSAPSAPRRQGTVCIRTARR
jgi:hypothetical protein